LSLEILKGNYGGGSHIQVGMKKGKIVFTEKQNEKDKEAENEVLTLGSASAGKE
jgi:hypothetical protein